MTMTFRTDRDRLLPLDQAALGVARELYSRVETAPIISPHGHVPPAMIAQDLPYVDAADLFVTHDHYVTRLLHAQGESLSDLVGAEAVPRDVWRRFCRHWHCFAGTASGYWIGRTLLELFGIESLSEREADATYDLIGQVLSTPAFRPQALLERFDVAFLATTDEPLDSLEHHARLRQSGIRTRIAPTFRPDRFVDASHPHFARNVQALLTSCNQAHNFDGYLRALEAERARFIAAGAVSADHGVVAPVAHNLDRAEASRLFSASLGGNATTAEREALTGHMLWQMARMSTEDGLVMTLHPGVFRNHHRPTHEAFGPDTGHDIPLPTTFVRGLRPLLDSFGTSPGFHLVLFAVDETVYSRELAPLAGFYPSVFVGAPWWFLDAPDAIMRWRSAVTETAGFYRTSGFVDDTRAFLSIPVRHDVSRRMDASFLAQWVRQGRLTMDQASVIIDDLVGSVPSTAFKL